MGNELPIVSGSDLTAERQRGGNCVRSGECLEGFFARTG